MCGIVGLLAPNATHAELEHALARSHEQLHHRGPDDSGVFIGGGVGLAARRLSIIDLAGGHQPLSNGACAERGLYGGPVWITYNGEVYNAPALRSELRAGGHHFRTESDTEVVVHAYEQWGEGAVARLRGMFAFALWDAPRQRLLLARDRFGIKPLYHAESGGRFAFASEVRPLLGLLPDLPRRLDPHALERLFELGFIPAPLSAFAGVQQLPAAHWLIVENGAQRCERYWELTYPPDGEHRRVAADQAAEEFTVRLREAVAAWRLSDVPVGALLSGGVDSSSLAALLTELSGGPIHTFTIGFTAASHDESAQARETARFIASHHHELTFTPADFDHLPRVVRHLETPQCSATSVPIYLLYKACREAGFKVILTGEGADELLGGYHWFEGDRRVRGLLSLPRPVRAALARAPIPASAAARRVLAHGTSDPLQRYALWQEVASPAQRAALLSGRLTSPPRSAGASPGALRQERGMGGEAALNGRHPLDQFLWIESQTRMIDFINLEVDRMSMASSVEARPPFLDHQLWEFCAALPPEYKLSPADRRGNKLLLRAGLRGKLPPAVLRQPKRGLATPHAEWWRAARLPAWAEDCLSPTALKETGYFVPEAVQRLRDQHRARKADVSRLLMGVLTTQLWHAEFMD
jgi:asparagine synthase (glutamine-hydrolysing)